MVKTVLVSIALALSTASSALALTPMGTSSTVTLSSTAAGAHPIALTLKLGYEMQCGWPGPGPVTVTLPASMSTPNVTASDVLVNGKTTAGVKASGHTLTIPLPARPKIMCDVIGPGTLTIELTKAAGLRNPAVGHYAVKANRTTASDGAYSVAFAIT